MPNIELYGFGGDEILVLNNVRQTMQHLGYNDSSAVTTIMYDGQVEDLQKEGIQLIGDDIDATENSPQAARLPAGTHLVDSYTEGVGPNFEFAPYIKVFAHTRERLEEMVKDLKSRKVAIDTETHLIGPPEEYQYPCVRVLTNKEKELENVVKAMEELGLRVYKKQVDFMSAGAMS